MTSKHRIERLEKRLGVRSGVDDIPIVGIGIDDREQIGILDSLADSKRVVSMLCTVDPSAFLSFEEAIQSIEAAKTRCD